TNQFPVNVDTFRVPEPSTLTLLILGGILVVGVHEFGKFWLRLRVSLLRLLAAPVRATAVRLRRPQGLVRVTVDAGEAELSRPASRQFAFGCRLMRCGGGQ